MLKKEAERITGGLSAPGKMPEGSYNLPASACQTGQPSSGRSQTRHAINVMHSKAAIISQMLKTR